MLTWLSLDIGWAYCTFGLGLGCLGCALGTDRQILPGWMWAWSCVTKLRKFAAFDYAVFLIRFSFSLLPLLGGRYGMSGWLGILLGWETSCCLYTLFFSSSDLSLDDIWFLLVWAKVASSLGTACGVDLATKVDGFFPWLGGLPFCLVRFDFSAQHLSWLHPDVELAATPWTNLMKIRYDMQYDARDSRRFIREVQLITEWLCHGCWP